jgi:hypothetical protein
MNAEDPSTVNGFRGWVTALRVCGDEMAPDRACIGAARHCFPASAIRQIGFAGRRDAHSISLEAGEPHPTTETES